MSKASRNILLIGGGGHCRSVLSAMLAAGKAVSGIIDSKEIVGQTVFGIPVIGTDEDLPLFDRGEYEIIVTVGSVKDNSRRDELYKMAKALGFGCALFVAAGAIVGRDVSLGEGTVVLESAVVNARAKTGGNCIINTGAIVEHDVAVGNSVHIAPGAIVGGCVRIGDRAFIGSGSTVIQGITMGPGAVVGAGSSVIEDVPEGAFVAGCPAKIIQ